jgi:hypothetical protein
MYGTCRNATISHANAKSATKEYTMRKDLSPTHLTSGARSGGLDIRKWLSGKKSEASRMPVIA